MTLSIERVPLEAVAGELEAHRECTLFHTAPWLEFLSRTQDAEPVIGVVTRGEERVGFFVGAIVSRFGIRILGSPFPGWTTAWMGFALDEGIDRWEAAEALRELAFGDLGCWHLELRDRRLPAPAETPARWRYTEPDLYELDLTATEEEIFGRMSSACRRAVRKGEKSGVIVEQASGEDFADEYYEQLLDVFAKQSLKPTYEVGRVRELIRALEPAGAVVLLRARSAEGASIATGIFPGGHGYAYFWGGASWREHQGLRPNEAIFWRAMREWKSRGADVLEMGGGGDYKERYGPEHLTVPLFGRSRVRGLSTLRDVAERIKRRGY